MGALSRIVLRHAAWVLVTLGILDGQDVSMFINDPELIIYTQMGLGLVTMGLTEAWYVLRKYLGENA